MDFTRRGFLKGVAGATAVGGPVSFEATKESDDLDLDIGMDGVSGEYVAEGQIMNLTYEGENKLDNDAGTYDIGMDDNLFSAEVANTYAMVDVDKDGSWELSVGLETGDDYKDMASCNRTNEEEYASVVESYGAEIDNGTIQVDDNKSSSDHADGIGDMLEEGFNDNSKC